jgi:transcriptional regulator NrdR family protein
MTCPQCGGKTTVRDSRTDSTMTARMRVCNDCSYRFYTTEMEMIDSQEDFNTLQRANELRRKAQRRGWIK